MPNDKPLKLTKSELEAIYPNEKPQVIKLEAASELLGIPVKTLRDWRSRGFLQDCSQKAGKHVLILPRRLIEKIFNGGLRPE